MKFRLFIDKIRFLIVGILFLTSVDGAAQDVSDAVQFSNLGGFYKDSIQVVLGPKGNNLEILYTLDGSEPRLEYLNGQSYQYKNSYAQFNGSTPGEFFSKSFQTQNYEDAIIVGDRSNEPDKLTQIATSFQQVPQYFPNGPVLKGTVLRARYYDPFTNTHGPITTHTYFVSANQYWDWNLPVISLSIQEDDLFDFDKGIYVGGRILEDYIRDNPGQVINGHTPANYKNKGDEWEKPANFEYFDSTLEPAVLNHQIDIRIHGGFSRSYPVKSLRLYAKNKYGVDYFYHKFFNDLELDQFKRFILRNSGNDYDFVLFRDGLIHELVRDLNVDTQAFQPTIVFINGEYWGIHHLRERLDDHYLEQHYGVERNRIDYLTRQYEAEEGTNEHYLAMMNFMRTNDMTSSDIYEQVKSMMDVDNFIDYLIIQIFIGNTDWPANNIDYWREQVEYSSNLPTGRDGRWRWILYDADFGFGLFNQLPNRNSLFYAVQPTNPSHSNPLWSTELYRLLNTNPEFRDQFSYRFMDLLNTTFQPDHIRSVADSIQTLIEPHIPMHIDRWSSPTSMTKWQEHLNHLHYYISERSNYIWLYLRSRYQLGSTYKLSVNVPNANEGQVQINTIMIPDSNRVWTGTYTTRKAITVTAHAFPPYEFSHWLEFPDSNSATFSGIFEDDFTLTPKFITYSSIEEPNTTEIPTQTILHQNYPNPFNPVTQISFSLHEPSNISIEVFDILGNHIQQVTKGYFASGKHSVTLDATGFSSGIYIYRMISDGGSQIRKMTILK